MKKYEVEAHEHSLLPEGKEWKLVWSDEFDGEAGSAPDESKWNYRTKYWGVKADQFTEKGVELDGKGNVVFRPVVEDGMVKSAQLQTCGNSFDELDLGGAIKNRIEGENGDNPWGQVEIWPLGRFPEQKFMHRYGYYEARVKLQKGHFWWSAFWIQSPSIGASGNPAFCGVESDIMEYFVQDEITTGNIFGGYGKDFKEDARVRYQLKNADAEYHRFGLEWNEDGYVFYCDGVETARSTGPVSQVEQFVLLSTEIQGYRLNRRKTTWTEEELSDRFICDYVRVFDEVK